MKNRLVMRLRITSEPVLRTVLYRVRLVYSGVNTPLADIQTECPQSLKNDAQ